MEVLGLPWHFLIFYQNVEDAKYGKSCLNLRDGNIARIPAQGTISSSDVRCTIAPWAKMLSVWCFLQLNVATYTAINQGIRALRSDFWAGSYEKCARLAMQTLQSEKVRDDLTQISSYMQSNMLFSFTQPLAHPAPTCPLSGFLEQTSSDGSGGCVPRNKIRLLGRPLHVCCRFRAAVYRL